MIVWRVEVKFCHQKRLARHPPQGRTLERAERRTDHRRVADCAEASPLRVLRFMRMARITVHVDHVAETRLAPETGQPAIARLRAVDHRARPQFVAQQASQRRHVCILLGHQKAHEIRRTLRAGGIRHQRHTAHLDAFAVAQPDHRITSLAHRNAGQLDDAGLPAGREVEPHRHGIGIVDRAGHAVFTPRAVERDRRSAARGGPRCLLHHQAHAQLHGRTTLRARPERDRVRFAVLDRQAGHHGLNVPRVAAARRHLPAQRRRAACGVIHRARHRFCAAGTLE